MIIYSANPTFVPSLSEIGDLSSITSCLVLPDFLMDTLLKQIFARETEGEYATFKTIKLPRGNYRTDSTVT